MNKELIEKLSAIREDLLAFQAQAKLKDLKKLAELVKEKAPPLERNYKELQPYMTTGQRSRTQFVAAFVSAVTGEGDLLYMVTTFVPVMLADLDDLAEKLKEK